MRIFKFLTLTKPHRTIDSYIKLKDQFNRNKIMFITWSEYPSENTDEFHTFEGNILTFFNFYGRSSPIVYEIYARRTGYFNHSIVIGNQNRHNQFISRAARLTIHFKL